MQINRTKRNENMKRGMYSLRDSALKILAHKLLTTR